MGRNPERDARELAARKEHILENAYRVFSEQSIDKVSMNEIADACGIGVATLYRHYRTKPELALAVSVWIWQKVIFEGDLRIRRPDRTAIEEFEAYLDVFLDLYRDHCDALRFNQFFNVYAQNEGMSAGQMEPFLAVIRDLADRFHGVYLKGCQDHTLCTDMPEDAMFSCSMHLMLAAVTRYAVGLIYKKGTDAEKELLLQKEMLMQQFRGKMKNP